MTGHKTNRTAVYGPVCPVVWEGSGRKTRPYPDHGWSDRRGPPRRERNPWFDE